MYWKNVLFIIRNKLPNNAKNISIKRTTLPVQWHALIYKKVLNGMPMGSLA